MRRLLQDTQGQLSRDQAAVRTTESKLQELRSKIAGYEETQRHIRCVSSVNSALTRRVTLQPCWHLNCPLNGTTGAKFIATS